MAIWDCVPGEDAWFAGYTVATILMEIQATVLDEELQWDMTQVCLHLLSNCACISQAVMLDASHYASSVNLLVAQFSSSGVHF